MRMTLQELGVPIFHPEKLCWRRSYLNEVESGELVGKQFKTPRGKYFNCKKITKKYVYFYDIEMDRKHALFYLPTLKQLNVQEQRQWIKDNYPGSQLHVPTTGCQMHGNIDATLTLSDGTVYTIPWNY